MKTTLPKEISRSLAGSLAICVSCGLAGGQNPFVSALSARDWSEKTMHVVEIDFAKPEGEISRLLSGYHHWEPDWLAATNSPIARRCCGYAWYDGAWPAEGEYNWEKLDEMVEGYLALGSKVILAFSYVPRWLWSDPDDPALNEPTVPANHAMFHFLRKGNTLPPRDYEKWEELIYRTVKHLNVEKKYEVIFEAWNEPNAVWFWNGTMEESLELYAHTARAVKRADPNTMIGGPTLAQGPVGGKGPDAGTRTGYAWMESFIRFCAENGVPVDFVSWHYYEAYAITKQQETSFTDQVGIVRRLIDKYPAIGSPNLVIDEWSYDWNYRRSKEIKALIDSPFNAAWVAQSLYEMVDCGVDMAAYCSSVGNSLDAPNPTFGVLEMFQRLGNVRIQANIEKPDPEIGVLASSDDGKVAIMVWGLPHQTVAAGTTPKTVRLSLENLPATNYRQVRYLASSTRTDTSLRTVEDKTLQTTGNLELEFELESNAVTLLELTAVTAPGMSGD